MTDTLLTPAEAAERLRVTPQTVTGMARRGDLPGAAKVGAQWRIPESAISGLFAESRPTNASEVE